MQKRPRRGTAQRGYPSRFAEAHPVAAGHSRAVTSRRWSVGWTVAVVLPALGSVAIPLALIASGAVLAGSAAQSQGCTGTGGAVLLPGGVGGGPANAGGSSGSLGVWKALRSAGFDAVHAAAVMGNVEIESAHTFNPTVVQGVTFSNNPSSAGGGGYGLVQWTPGSKLKHYIGNAQPTIPNEVNALKAQLNGKGSDPEAAVGIGFFAARGVNAATIAFHLKYERSASTDSSQRVTAANHWYRQYSGAAISATTTPKTSTTTTASISAPSSTISCTPGTTAGAPGSAAPPPAVGGYRTVSGVRIPIPKGPAGVAVNYALSQVGKAYVWGTQGPRTFDCSGLTSAAWRAAGVSIIPQTEKQYRTLPHVPLSQARPGDIFWHPGHVQLFLGVINGKSTVVEAANPRAGIRVDKSGWMHPKAVLRVPTA